MSLYKIGFAMCGSFCTFAKAIEQMKKIVKEGHEVIPIMSFNASSIDTRFGKADDFKKEIEGISGRRIINSIEGAEPIGPKRMTDVMVIAPCTGNTLGKLCNAITDTPVTMAAKSHLRIQRPLVITLATNDALAATAQNIGKAMNTKNIYFVPFSQDDPENKPSSLVADFGMIMSTLELALSGKQIQSVLK